MRVISGRKTWRVMWNPMKMREKKQQRKMTQDKIARIWKWRESRVWSESWMFRRRFSRKWEEETHFLNEFEKNMDLFWIWYSVLVWIFLKNIKINYWRNEKIKELKCPEHFKGSQIKYFLIHHRDWKQPFWSLIKFLENKNRWILRLLSNSC